ncbi:DUF1700 domain-containing protein [Candidatus Soleaferrea massiliensis]|uniref:DUF1700 domain-containing protein n=1 Tax=Candidatus Soleaferrea massiliensis TaxID=1470354 RepID=UPI00058FE585|nr:DUF1700 domain-containing protein [Candidatus Soleaferrea massiliensis]
MNKQQFLEKLASLISTLPKAEREKALSFYAEIIDDRVEAGENEADIIAEFGDIQLLAAKILAENGQIKKKSTSAKVWTIVGLILGSPVWLSLGITFAAVAFVLYVVAWVLLVCFYVIAFCMFVVCMVGVITSFVFIAGNPAAGLFQIGAGLVCGGLGILTLIGTIVLTRLMVRASAYLMNKIRSFWNRKVVRQYA